MPARWEHSVTIPEGLTIAEIAEIFSAGGWVDKKRFVDLAHDALFIEQLGLAGIDSLEGYLFPDTYRLVRPSSGEAEIVRMLVRRSLHIWQGLAGQNSSGLDRHQVFTLASMIEKESGAGEEPTNHCLGFS